MPVVVVEMWEGRNVEEKKQLARDLTDAFVRLGVPVKEVNVILRETPKSCWAQGGELCADFKIPPAA